jgi:hypothetical protein
MAEIYLFPKTAEEQEAERQLTEAMRALNAAIKHAAQCGFEIELRPGTWSFTTYTRTPVPYIDLRLVSREGTCSQNLSRSEN